MSVVVPAREWDPFLISTIESIEAQELPVGVDLEVVVGLAGEPPDEVPDGVEIVRNPTGTIPDALNLAIAASRGELISRVDARCLVAPDHIARVIDILSDADIGCTGGAALVLDRGWFGSAYAVAFNSPMLGPSSYRYSRRSGPSSSPYTAAWRRETLDVVGGFDSALVRNQDNELADRIADLGLVVWYDADMVVGYRNNRGLLETIRHHFDFGYWRMLQRGRGQRGLSKRHILSIAAAGVAGVIALMGLRSKRTRRHVIATALGMYCVAVGGSYRTAKRLRDRRLDIELAGFDPSGVVCAPLVAALLDTAWVAGLLWGGWTARRTND